MHMQVRKPFGNLMLPGLHDPDPYDFDEVEPDDYAYYFIPGDAQVGEICFASDPDETHRGLLRSAGFDWDACIHLPDVI